MQLFDRKNILFTLSPALIAALMSLPSSIAQAYSVLDLGLPIGAAANSASEAHGISRNGAVVGTWWDGGSSQGSQYAFRYAGGSMSDLGALKSGGYDYSVAYAINTNQIVGQSTATGGNYHAFTFTNGLMSDLGGGAWASANAINQAGQIVGEFTTSTNSAVIHASIYTNGAMRDLGSLGGLYSSAKGINDTGIVVGESSDTVGNIYAFVFSNNVMTSLGSLGGNYSSAHAINNSGMIVGESTVANGEVHAFIYRNGTMTDLGTLGGTNSSAWGINSSGQVIGYATDSNQISHAFTYSGSTLFNLDAALPAGSPFTNLALAYGMNEAGQIVGGGFTSTGDYHAFLVTPPIITLACSTNITVVAPSLAGAVVAFNLNATDGCSTPNIFADPASGSTFPLGTNVVNVTASDLCGHTNVCSFTVTVKPPLTVTCSTNITAVAANSGGAVVNFSVAATGGCDDAPIVSANPSSGSTFPIGTNTVSVTAYDSCGNTNTCDFTVVVMPPPSPVTLTSPVFSNGQFQVSIVGIVGQRFAILESSNLTDWTWLVTNTLISSSTNFTDVTTNTARFYRSATLP